MVKVGAAFQFIIGFGVGLWGYHQIPGYPEDGCVTLLVGGLLMVSSLGRLFGDSDLRDSPAEPGMESKNADVRHTGIRKGPLPRWTIDGEAAAPEGALPMGVNRTRRE